MQVGAVLVLGGCIGDDVSQLSGRKYFAQKMPAFFGEPAAMLDLLGEPILYRIVENLRKSGVGPIFLVTDDAHANHAVVKNISRWQVHVRSVPEERVRAAIQAALTTCRESGAHTALVMQASAYVELDVAGLLKFHGATGQTATCVSDNRGPLGIDMFGGEYTEQLVLPDRTTHRPAPIDYMHRRYANRLSTPQDLRNLAQDALLQRCTIRPIGSELRPGVWVAPNARLHPRARLVNPCFIGAYTKLRSGVVVTRGTNIEHHCEVDCGSVVENATILPYTYLGSSLDIAHSIVNRNIVVDVGRAVEVEISDGSLIRSTSPFPRLAAEPALMRPRPVPTLLPQWTLRDAFSSFLPRTPLSPPASAQLSYNTAEAEPRLGKAPRAGDPRAA